MVNVDNIEYNGVSYITNDLRGIWVWEVKPVLETIDGKEQWVLPEEYRGKPGMTLLMNQVNGSVLPTLLNASGKDFNTTLGVFDKPRIFKIVLEEVTKCDDTDIEQFKPFREAISPARLNMSIHAAGQHPIHSDSKVRLSGLPNEN